MIEIMLWSLTGIISGGFATAGLATFKRQFRLKKGIAQLDKTVFKPLIAEVALPSIENQKKRALEPAPVKKERFLEHLEHLTDEVESADLPPEMAWESQVVMSLLDELNSLPDLSVETQHNVTVMGEQVISTLLRFSQLSNTNKQDKDFIDEVMKQFSFITSAVEQIKAQRKASELSEMKADTEFLRSKFNFTEANVTVE